MRNSIAPPAPTSGIANAACSPASEASRARGKFGSFVTSAIHAGRPRACTRPGRPSPGASEIVREAAAKRSSGAPPADQVAMHFSNPPGTGSQTPP